MKRLCINIFKVNLVKTCGYLSDVAQFAPLIALHRGGSRVANRFVNSAHQSVGRKSADCASGQDGISLKVRRKLTKLKNIYNLINWYYENKKCKITAKRVTIR